jgi:hypothetical protein
MLTRLFHHISTATTKKPGSTAFSGENDQLHSLLCAWIIFFLKPCIHRLLSCFATKYDEIVGLINFKKSIFKEKGEIRVGIGVNTAEVYFSVIKEGHAKISLLDEGKYPLDDVAYALSEIKKVAQDFTCHLALPQQHIMMKTLFFSDYFKRKEINELLTLNSEFYFSHPIEKISFDFEFLDKLGQKIRVIASKKECIQMWKDLCLNANLNLKTISLDILALEAFLVYSHVIRQDNIYGIFFINGNEFLQIVMMDAFVYFVNSVIMAENNIISFQQEILKFFRLYESSPSFIHPITDIILLGFDHDFESSLKAHFSLPIISNNDLARFPLKNSSQLLALGMILKC